MERLLSEISEQDWAYLAGIIDGEGNIRFAVRGNRKSSYETRVSIYNTDVGLINWILGKFGGSTFDHANNNHRFGHKSVHKVYWASSDDVRRILTGTQPYMIVKKRVATALLAALQFPREELVAWKLLHDNQKEVSRNE